jgi:hypothetical protein
MFAVAGGGRHKYSPAADAYLEAIPALYHSPEAKRIRTISCAKVGERTFKTIRKS